MCQQLIHKSVAQCILFKVLSQVENVLNVVIQIDLIRYHFIDLCCVEVCTLLHYFADGVRLVHQVMHQVGKIGHSRSVQNKFLARFVVHLVDIERERPDRNTNHLFLVVEELNGFGVQRKVLSLFVEEKLNCQWVELERKRFQERDVIGQESLVGKVEFVHDEIVYVVIGQQVKDSRFTVRVLQQDAERLNHLNLDRLFTLLTQDLNAQLENILLAEKVKETRVVLVAPDHQLSNLPQNLHNCRLVLARHHYILAQLLIQVPIQARGRSGDALPHAVRLATRRAIRGPNSL